MSGSRLSYVSARTRRRRSGDLASTQGTQKMCSLGKMLFLMALSTTASPTLVFPMPPTPVMHTRDVLSVARRE
ncbi:hypothetical protein B0H12DRAFT_1123485, partial [Mycena haematopus]